MSKENTITVHDPRLDTPEGKQTASELLWNIINPKFTQAQEIINKELGITVLMQPTKIKTISDWSKKTTYKCVTQTMFFKDMLDVKNGLGFIYNMIEPKKLLVASVGLEKLNEANSGAYIKNSNIYIDLDGSKDNINRAIIEIIEKFIDCYRLKYKLSKDQCNNLKMELLKGMI